MGWAGGSDIYREMAYGVDRKDIHPQVQILLLTTLASTLSDADWDTFDECWGISSVSDLVLKQVFDIEDEEDTD
jgi:hypothetical protein